MTQIKVTPKSVDAALDVVKARDREAGIVRDFQDYASIAADIHEELMAAAPFMTGGEA